MTKTTKHPNADWPWWKILPAGLIGMAGFGVLIGFLPYYSLSAMMIGLSLAFLGLAAGLWSWKTWNWWARLIGGGIWSLQVLAIAARAWEVLLRNHWFWMTPILFAYFLAWFLPALHSGFSEFLWREQTTPQTKVGRVLLGLMISIAPTAGTIGASVGMYSSRFGELSMGYITLGGLCSVGAIIIAFAISYQIWPDRPWAALETQDKVTA